MGTKGPEFRNKPEQAETNPRNQDFDNLWILLRQLNILRTQILEALQAPYAELSKRRNEFEATPTARNLNDTRQAIETLKKMPDIVDTLLMTGAHPKELLKVRPSKRLEALGKLQESEVRQARAADKTRRKMLLPSIEKLKGAANQTAKITPPIFHDPELKKQFQEFCEASRVDSTLNKYDIKKTDFNTFRIDTFLTNLSQALAAIHKFLTTFDTRNRPYLDGLPTQTSDIDPEPNVE